MRKIAACDDSCPERSYLQPCKEISSGHRNAYSTLASYSSIGAGKKSQKIFFFFFFLKLNVFLKFFFFFFFFFFFLSRGLGCLPAPKWSLLYLTLYIGAGKKTSITFDRNNIF